MKNRVPPTGPLPPGGVLLGGPREIPPTQHKTVFNGCSLGLFVILDEDSVCQGYKLVIQDPREARVYEADFGQELKDEWQGSLNQFPDVGQIPEEIQNNGSAA